MVALKYKVIKSKSQYKEYFKMLEDLVTADLKSKEMKDEIELLTLLIEKWDEENNSFDDVDPITLLHSLMEEQGLKAKDLVEILGVSKGLVSDILNYRKGLSKDIIRSLSEYFKVSQEAFNRPYELAAN
jgi:HTH-type transcriptional regulator / antitoxin HigA